MLVEEGMVDIPRRSQRNDPLLTDVFNEADGELIASFGVLVLLEKPGQAWCYNR